MAPQLRTVIAACCLALAFCAGGSARAATATLSAAVAPEGYTRLQFAFDTAPDASARLANGVLIVSFSEPVELTTGELGRGLGSLIGAIRRDPDGTAVRMALNDSVRLVATPAGERFYVDLLPTSWKGLPPPLPKDVIEQLSRDAREARALRAEEARLKAKPEMKLAVEGATHPTFRRLIFKLGGDAPVDWHRSGPSVAVSIGAPYAFDLPAARARLPLEFAELEARRTDKGLTILVPAKGAGEARGFREDGDFILDIDAKARDAAEDAQAEPKSAAASSKDGHSSAAASPPASAPSEPAKPAAPHGGVDHGAGAEIAAKQGRPPDGDDARATAPARDAASKAREAAAAPSDPARTVDAGAPKTPSIRRVGQSLRLVFPFSRPAPAAVFERGRTLWVVFDDPAPLALDQLRADAGKDIVAVEPFAVERGQALRLKLAEPRLVSVSAEGNDWIVSLGEDVLTRSGAIDFANGADRNGRPAVHAELQGLGTVRQIVDPEIGDRLSVATLAAPIRATPAVRQFVEFAALPTAQGLALALASDDATVTASIERISVERPDGMTLSPAVEPAAAPAEARRSDIVLAAGDWAAENAAPFAERENALIRAAALSAVEDRPAARLELAKFYQLRGRAADSAAVLGAIVEDAGLSERDPRIAILRAAAEVELGRPSGALAILAGSGMRARPEASLWRAAAEEQAGRLEQARAALKDGAPAIAKLAPPLMARFVALDVRLALEAGDAARAEALYHDLEVLPATEGVGAREILRARIEQGLGRKDKALAAFAAVANGRDPAAAAEAELRSIDLGIEMKTLATADATTRLERLTTGWRGDRVEAEALARLVELYGAAGRWRDAFSTLRVAVQAFPDADDTRALQDRMQARFTELFLGDGLDKMPRLDALALFYDFKELLPGGKRGDELVRRLADKLVEVDLLDQAGELLGYQIDKRLTGAARAQVAARAALVDLMNGKPAKAIEVLRKTRQADLPGNLLRARIRLEARALAETGRVDLALEMADGLDAAEARRVRADILWSARRWPEAGETLEAALGSSWRGPTPLEPSQRGDVMRAAIASALAGDGLAVDRIRQKFAPKMANGPEAAAFEIVTAPIEARGDAFREIARSVAATSSFQAFLDEYRRGSAQPIAGEAAKDAAPPKA